MTTPARWTLTWRSLLSPLLLYGVAALLYVVRLAVEGVDLFLPLLEGVIHFCGDTALLVLMGYTLPVLIGYPLFLLLVFFIRNRQPYRERGWIVLMVFYATVHLAGQYEIWSGKALQHLMKAMSFLPG